jgi:hypothetical protein
MEIIIHNSCPSIMQRAVLSAIDSVSKAMARWSNRKEKVANFGLHVPCNSQSDASASLEAKSSQTWDQTIPSSESGFSGSYV